MTPKKGRPIYLGNDWTPEALSRACREGNPALKQPHLRLDGGHYRLWPLNAQYHIARVEVTFFVGSAAWGYLFSGLLDLTGPLERTFVLPFHGGTLAPESTGRSTVPLSSSKTDDAQMRLVLLLTGLVALMPVARAADAGRSTLECPSPSQVNNPQIKREVAELSPSP